MNIGETDADGWTYVRFGDAAKAAQEGTHEVYGRCLGDKWLELIGSKAYFNADWQYRIKEKARTITVTIPRPREVGIGIATGARLILVFDTLSQRNIAHQAFNAAMEQS